MMWKHGVSDGSGRHPSAPPHDPAVSSVQVHLEEVGQHSWIAAVLTTITGTSGSAQFRFVARARGTPDEVAGHVLVGSTFPLMRLQDLDDETSPDAWSEIAHERFAELDAELVTLGWTRRPERGEHWWSATYERGEGPRATS